MVRAEDVGMDGCIGNLRTQTFGGNEIVDAPACILLACLKTVRPPGIGNLFRLQCAEGVDESALKQGGKLLAFLIREAGIHAVGLGILQVYLLVCHV